MSPLRRTVWRENQGAREPSDKEGAARGSNHTSRKDDCLKVMSDLSIFQVQKHEPQALEGHLITSIGAIRLAINRQRGTALKEESERGAQVLKGEGPHTLPACHRGRLPATEVSYTCSPRSEPTDRRAARYLHKPCSRNAPGHHGQSPLSQRCWPPPRHRLYSTLIRTAPAKLTGSQGEYSVKQTGKLSKQAHTRARATQAALVYSTPVVQPDAGQC